MIFNIFRLVLNASFTDFINLRQNIYTSEKIESSLLKWYVVLRFNHDNQAFYPTPLSIRN